MFIRSLRLKVITRSVLFLFALAASALWFMSSATATQAATCNFASTEATNDYNINANWSCLHVPGNGDSVLIGAGTTTNMTATPTSTVSSIATSGTINVLTFNLAATSSLSLLTNGFVTSTSGRISSSGTLTLVLGTVVSSTTGTLTFDGVASSTGKITSISGNMSFGDTFQNNGIFNVGAGTATTTGSFTNTSSTNNNTGILSVLADFTNTGTYSANSGTFRVAGTATQSITGESFNNFGSIKGSGTATIVTNNGSIGGTLTSTGGGTLSLAALNLSVTGVTTLGSGTTVTSTSGVLTFVGAVTSTGSIGSSSGGFVASNTLQNNGTLSIGSGSSTMIGTITNAASSNIQGGTGTLNVAGNWTNSGVLVGGTGTVVFNSTTTQSIGAEPGFYNLTISNTAGTVTLTGNVTATGTTTVVASATLAVAATTLTAVGTVANSGTITNTTGGKIVHTAESVVFTNAFGTQQTTYMTPGSVFVTVQDSNRNLVATTIETVTTTVTTAGGDSLVVTLTETGLATGIFRNADAFIATNANSSISTSNSTIDILTTSNGTSTYVDMLDSSDQTISSAVSFTFVAASSGGGGGGGGGGGSGASGSVSLPTPAIQANLANLKTINVEVHYLVKLADDGNAQTQGDSAVYYVGADGMRHAFPNSKVYFTWYQDFGGVRIVTATQLASIPLGKNVTYKPGVRMVKFLTDPKVYAVAKDGVLRWINGESTASSLYGATWNTKIDDIDDAFYVNYQFGTDVGSLVDFTPANVTASVAYPSDSLQL